MDDKTLHVYGVMGGGVIEGGEQGLGGRVIPAALDGQGPLAGVREETVQRDGVHEGGIEEVGAFEAGHGEDDGVELAVAQFSNAGVDVAAYGFDLEIGTEGKELAFAAEGAGADSAALGELLDRGCAGGDQDVSNIFARGDGGDEQVGLIDQRNGDGNVFEAVDHEVDLVIEEGQLKLACKKSLAAQLVKWPIGDLVAAGFEDFDGDAQAGMQALQ